MQTAILFKITPQVKREIIEIIDERVKEAHVTKEDFSKAKMDCERPWDKGRRTCSCPEKDRERT